MILNAQLSDTITASKDGFTVVMVVSNLSIEEAAQIYKASTDGAVTVVLGATKE